MQMLIAVMSRVMNGLMLERDLRLMDISPNWSMALRAGNTDVRLAIDNDRWCIVGEAWGFNDRFRTKCGHCYRFAVEFPFTVHGKTYAKRKTRRDDFYIIDLPTYKKLVKEFLEHFNKEHKEQWYLRQSN